MLSQKATAGGVGGAAAAIRFLSFKPPPRFRPSGCKEKIPCGRLHSLSGSVRLGLQQEEDDEV